MDYNHKTQQVTAQATEHSKLGNIQALVLIMGVSQSQAYLSLCLQDLTKDIPDQHLLYFLQYLRYLDDLQNGVTAEEITELQNKADLQGPELHRQCQDYDCCHYKADLSLPPKGRTRRSHTQR